MKKGTIGFSIVLMAALSINIPAGQPVTLEKQSSGHKLSLLKAESQPSESSPYLVKNISAMDSWGSLGTGTEILGIGDTVYFVAEDILTGNEVWKSDGTAAGTVLVKDIYPGADSSYPANLTDINGTLFFRANDGLHGCELWKSDGTAAGTVMVKDIGTEEWQPSSYPENLTIVNGTLFFTSDDGTHGRELWKSDGTAAGTVLVKDISISYYDASYPQDLINVNGTLFFSAQDDTHGRELWKSDGTAAGTVMVKDIYPGSVNNWGYPASLTAINGTLFFMADDGTHGTELWKSDGTDAGTVIVKDIYPGGEGSFPQGLLNINGTLFFSASGGEYGFALWKSDGTEAGTVIVKDYYCARYFANVNGTLFFSAQDDSHGRELWKSDGTETGTIQVKDIASGSSSSLPKYLTNVNGTLFFRAYCDASGFELWKSDGTTAGTAIVKDIFSGASSSYPENLTNVNGTLFFSANDGIHGTELWKSDGTEAGTVLVKNVSYCLEPGVMASVNETVFLSASQGTYDYELWKSDGTEAGTVLVKDICPGPDGSNPYYLTDVNGILFFTADDGTHGRELWKSDGTEAGTVMVKDISTDELYPSSDPENLTNVSGTLFFTAMSDWNYELWKSDGTEAGTVLVKDLNYHYGTSPCCLTNVSGTLFFMAGDWSDELWKSDGTAVGTVPVTYIGQSFLIDVNGTLFFVSYCCDLGKSDGTEAGTVQVKSFGNGIENLANVEGTLFFAAFDETTGSELWKSDGTTAGTVLVKDIYPGVNSSDPEYLANARGMLLFTATDGIHGRELWIGDGTEAGTIPVKDINPGASSSIPHDLAIAGGTAFFVANDGTSGYELWKSDGTEAGTARLTDINAGAASSEVQNLTAAESRLFFTIASFSPGEGLWAYNLSPPPPLPVVSTNNTAVELEMCPHTGVRITWDMDPADWNDGGIGTRAYQVTRGGSVIVTLPYGTTEYVDNRGTNGQSYLYQALYRNGYWGTAATEGVFATDWAGPSPTITGPNPACGNAALATQTYNTYQWYLDGSLIPGAESRNYSAVAPGTYTVLVTDSRGCPGTSPGFNVYPYPEKPVISGLSSGCNPVALSTGTYASYQWYQNGSYIYGAHSQNYSATQTATYSVKVGNAGGCNATSSGYAVTVYETPLPYVNGPSSDCVAAALSTGTFSTYQWIKDGSDIPGATSQGFSATQSGTYKVRVTNASGCTGTSAEKAVTVSQSLNPVITGPSNGCVSVALSTGTFSSYQWIKDGIDIPGAVSRNFSATQSGIYSVRATSTYCIGTSAGMTVTVYQNPSPTISGEHSNICPATYVPLTTSSYSAYQWYFNEAAIPGATSQSYNATASGNYKVKVTDDVGCSGFSTTLMVSLGFCPNSEVSPPDAIYPFILVKDTASSTGYYLYFQKLYTVVGYNIYEGDLVSPWDGLYHHGNKPGSLCTALVTDFVNGEMRAEITPSEGSHYYLVTAHSDGVEGPSGFNSLGVEIDPLQSTCDP
jgi:ELWxxDGT repeat protein